MNAHPKKNPRSETIWRDGSTRMLHFSRSLSSQDLLLQKSKTIQNRRNLECGHISECREVQEDQLRISHLLTHTYTHTLRSASFGLGVRFTATRCLIRNVVITPSINARLRLGSPWLFHSHQLKSAYDKPRHAMCPL